MDPEELNNEESSDLNEADDDFRIVASSMVEGWGYDREAGQITISFRSGSRETYDCSPEEWEEAKNAVSPGRFVHQAFLSS